MSLSSNILEDTPGRTPFIFVIRSADRVPGQTPDDYTISLPVDINLEPYTTVHCSNVIMMGSRYCINETNNHFYCAIHLHTTSDALIHRYVLDVVVQPGSHSSDDLAKELALSIPRKLSELHPTFPALELDITHDDARMKFAITSRMTTANLSVYNGGSVVTLYGLTGRLWFEVLDKTRVQEYNPAIDYAETLNASLGYTEIAYPTQSNGALGTAYYGALNTYISNIAHYYECLPSLVLCSDLVVEGMRTSNLSLQLPQSFALVAEPAYGRVGMWEPNEIIKRSLQRRRVTSIRIYWRDTKGKAVDFNSTDHVLTLTFM